MNRQTTILMLLFLLAPLAAKAQWSFDITSIEAYINDHKKQRSLLLARSTLEYSNKLLHEYSRDATVEYKETELCHTLIPIFDAMLAWGEKYGKSIPQKDDANEPDL